MQIFLNFSIIQNDCYSVLKAFFIFFIERIYFCFFAFYPIRRIYIRYQYSDLLYGIYNTINEHNQRQSFYFSSIFLNHFEIQSASITSSASSLIMVSMLSLFHCIACPSSLSSLDKVKLIVIVNWILHVSDVLRLFMVSFRYGLVLLRYFLIHSVFLSPFLLYSR